MRLEHPAGAVDVEIRRSARRKRTLSARWEGERIVVLAPAWETAGEPQIVRSLVDRLLAKRGAAPGTDAEDLEHRTRRLLEAYFPGLEPPASVRWVSNQSTRWGSTSIRARTIRLSHHLMGMPDWVIDSVLVHELAHLIVPSHSPRFWELCRRYPRTDDATIYLRGVEFGRRLRASEPPPADQEDDGEDPALSCPSSEPVSGVS